MSSIGSRPGLGSGSQLEVSATRPVGAVGGVSVGALAGGVSGAQSGSTASLATPASGAGSGSPPSAGIPYGASSQSGSPSQASMVSTTALSAGSPPVNADRVVAIRKAIESGSYPLIPTKISDAMIAAGLTLRIRK